MDNKSFRFHYCRVFVMILLVIPPLRANFSPAESCLAVSKTIFNNPDPHKLIKDPKFILDLFDCVLLVNKALKDSEWKGAFSIPENVADFLIKHGKSNLVLMMVNVMYKSIELNVMASDIERDYELDDHDFNVLYENLNTMMNYWSKVILTFEKLITQEMETGESQSNALQIFNWEKVNDSAKKKFKNILKELSNLSDDTIKELLITINEKIKKIQSYMTWGLAYRSGAAALCVGSIFILNPAGCGMFCAGSGGAIVVNYHTYQKLAKINKKCETLFKKAEKLHLEIIRYQEKVEYGV
ncbi:uncharacterized protein LOC110252954 [Exaiptasia diaphana]|uniref:Uncharacterized protein n=1 Tax=Exaiptasia diaphana TaxID=2652724 RepID=A0A913Y7P6_EXADI|nr:uncharacterized protein LOC110252954 [Exaiptasia diaphana]XP_028519148.1 uncharacterized protein LOC110252954 [Exaiptasia diaphana]